MSKPNNFLSVISSTLYCQQNSISSILITGIILKYNKQTAVYSEHKCSTS